jgi:phosphoglycolate phosphatase
MFPQGMLTTCTFPPGFPLPATVAEPVWDAIVFDLDGTLWDATAVVAQAWDRVVQALAPHAGRIDVRAVRGVMGLAHAAMSQRLFPNVPHAEREALVAACYVEESRLLHQMGAPPYPGVAEGLAELAARVPLAIVSNCQAGYIETFADTTGLGRWFADHECHGNTGRSKGENLAAVIARQGWASAVYVGDTAGDQEAADAAGTGFVHAAYGFGQPKRPAPSVARFEELVTYLLPRIASRAAGPSGFQR